MKNNRLFLDRGKKNIVNKPSFKELSIENAIVRLCGSFNALSAMIIEEEGFEGLWLSSFEAHTGCRLPDASILTITDYCDLCNKISDRTNLPILVDGDEGGGSPINTIRMVREYEKNGASGICIEDNKYPKRCSFYEGIKRELEKPSYHASKIKAACDNRMNSDFFVVARTEALIVGMSVNEAIDRSNLYVDSGADAILIHDKKDKADGVFEFSEKFKNRVPLICVPTTYNQVREEELISNGFSYVIYANYGIRSCIKAMRKAFQEIAKNRTLSSANEYVSSMEEVFKLVGLEDLRFNENKYK